MDFKVFKVVWNNGDVNLLIGETIADACNQATGDLSAKALKDFNEVVFPTEDTLETERFSCAACKGPVELWQNNQQYRGLCRDCRMGMEGRYYDDELQAILAWNRHQLEQTKLMIQETTALHTP